MRDESLRCTVFLLLAILGMILVSVFSGCSHSDLFNGTGHKSRLEKPVEDCPICPVCGQEDGKHGHTNKGHHYGQFKHFTNG